MKTRFTLHLLLVVSFDLTAQPVLIKDINPIKSNPYTSMSVLAGNASGVFIAADNGIDGEELWYSDGTANGTIMLRDISATGSSYPRLATFVGTTFYFFAAENWGSTPVLHKSNGTVAGTVRIRDFGIVTVTRTVAVGSSLFIFLTNSNGNQEVWKSDGTTAGTVMVKSIGSGNDITEVAVVGTVAYFAYGLFSTGTELWKTDGTSAGTVLVKDIYPGSTGSQPQSLIAYNSKLFFSADNGTNGRELWSSNGTGAGTTMAYELNAWGDGVISDQPMAVCLGKLFYAGDDGGFTFGREVYFTDGTLSGTSLFDLTPGSSDTYVEEITATSTRVFFNSSFAGPLYSCNLTTVNLMSSVTGLTAYDVAVIGSNIYFIDNAGDLWKSDGTAAGTSQIGPAALTSNNFLIAAGSTLYFAGETVADGLQLWKSSGTLASTVKVRNIHEGANSSNILSHGILNSNLSLFSANDGSNGQELWKTDGTTGGTSLVKDINPGASGSNPEYFIPWNGQVYFNAYTTNFGTELWKSDGTNAGTALVKDINSGVGNANPGNFVYYNNLLYFVANSGGNDYELWKTDGTSGGTVLVKNINSSGSSMGNVVYSGILGILNGLLVMAADNGVNGSELWVSDGTAGGTQLLKDINPGSNGSQISGGIIFNGIFYFVANDGNSGRELWRTDATSGGTYQVKDIYTGGSNSDPTYFVEYNGKFYFLANSPSGNELWSSDGSGGGTNIVKDIEPGSGSSSINQILIHNGLMYLSAFTSANGRELWVSDGTTGGTSMVKDIYSGTSGGLSSTLVEQGSNIYFVGETASQGLELWRSDGTSAGTVIVTDLVPGSNSSFPSNLFATSQGLICVADNLSDGYEIFVTNGSSMTLVGNLNADAQSSVARNFYGLGNKILFQARTTSVGEELAVLNGYTALNVGIDELVDVGNHSHSPFLLYPVPAENEIFIHNQDAGILINSYEIINADGRLVKAGVAGLVDHLVLSVGNLDAGVYFIKTLASDHSIYINRFVKL